MLFVAYVAKTKDLEISLLRAMLGTAGDFVVGWIADIDKVVPESLIVEPFAFDGSAPLQRFAPPYSWLTAFEFGTKLVKQKRTHTVRIAEIFVVVGFLSTVEPDSVLSCTAEARGVLSVGS